MQQVNWQLERYFKEILILVLHNIVLEFRSATEYSGINCKSHRLFSNGFKVRTNNAIINHNTIPLHIYVHDVPFKYNNTHLMSKTKDIIDEALGAVELAKSEPKERKVIPRPQENDDIENDYKYQRENFYNLVERGTDAIDGILEIARESEHPRTYEVGW